MQSGGSNSRANAAAASAACALAVPIGHAFGGAIGGAVAAAAAAAGCAVDQALAGPEVDVDKVKEKVAKDPSLRRRDDESFQEWVKRLGIFSMIDDVHESRRFDLRAVYTDRMLMRSAQRTQANADAGAELAKMAEHYKIDPHALAKAYAIYQSSPQQTPQAVDPRAAAERFMGEDKGAASPLPLIGKRSDVMLSVPIRVGK